MVDSVPDDLKVIIALYIPTHIDNYFSIVEVLGDNEWLYQRLTMMKYPLLHRVFQPIMEGKSWKDLYLYFVSACISFFDGYVVDMDIITNNQEYFKKRFEVNFNEEWYYQLVFYRQYPDMYKQLLEYKISYRDLFKVFNTRFGLRMEELDLRVLYKFLDKYEYLSLSKSFFEIIFQNEAFRNDIKYDINYIFVAWCNENPNNCLYKNLLSCFSYKDIQDHVQSILVKSPGQHHTILLHTLLLCKDHLNDIFTLLFDTSSKGVIDLCKQVYVLLNTKYKNQEPLITEYLYKFITNRSSSKC